MNLQLIRVIEDGSAKTFVYQDLDDPVRSYRVTEKKMAEIFIKFMQSGFKRLTDVVRSFDFESVCDRLASFNAAYDKLIESEKTD